MELSDLTLEQKKKALANYTADGFADDSRSDITEAIRDFIHDGVKGYAEMSEEEFQEEWNEVFSDLSESEIMESLENYLEE
jgi:inactivated superfamily I helicase